MWCQVVALLLAVAARASAQPGAAAPAGGEAAPGGGVGEVEDAHGDAHDDGDAHAHGAEADRDHSSEAAPAPGRVWPTLAALGPGFFVHGSGHFVAGMTGTGWRLLAMQGVGLGAAVAGLGGLALTGASPKFVMPLLGLSLAGGGLVVASALADIYGVLAPEGGFGVPVGQPALVVEAGPRFIDDRLFAYDYLGYASAAAWLANFRLQGQSWFGLDHSNQRSRLLLAHRFARFGPADYMELELAGTHHRYAPERFSMGYVELALSGRLSLARLGPTLRGAFLDYALGYALGHDRQFGGQSESDEMTLARFGFGFFIGQGGEVRTYYDHRHDDYAAGLKLPGLGSGALGHIGLSIEHYLTDAWGLALRAETGSAHIVGLSLLHRRRKW